MTDPATTTADLLVFTDLDGTLIDHDSYSWTPATEALDALKTRGAGIVLSSSKTAAEMVVLRRDLGLSAWPAIVENGAGLLPAGQSDLPADDEYHKLRDALGGLPDDLRRHFTGFADMSLDGVIEATGLDRDSAVKARQRCFSEPGLWSGSDAEKNMFLQALAEQGVRAQQGGRFLTLSFGANKADQMRRLIARYEPKTTIALGDAPNDIDMLETADHPVVIANPHRSALPPLKNESFALRTDAAGPLGWNDAILSLLDRFDARH